MKRLIFCFDGTWHRLDAPCPTNVVITAESILPLTQQGTAQLVFYDEGVGTGQYEKVSGGLFGAGLVKNLADAYRFLIFNYTPGDQIYIFGFSRGAYTARSFAGLLSTCGILLRKEAGRVNEAIELYKNRDSSEAYKEAMMCFRQDRSPEVCVSDEENAWRTAKVPGYAAQPARRLQVEYIGVWDTVGALGIPARYSVLGWFNEKHQFHDTRLSPFVKSARHAVAIDERRLDFQPTLWDNIDALNARAGKKSGDPDAPYQQMWFPGVHGSVGGGGDRRGLSDQTLDWVLDGARAAGLSLDAGQHSRIFELAPNYAEFLENKDDPGFAQKAMILVAGGDRQPGPAELYEVSVAARRRWLEQPANLRDGVPYRPNTLAGVAAALDELDPKLYGLGAAEDAPPAKSTYEVKRGDTLRGIALKIYGRAEESLRIFEANLHKIDHPDRIYPGQLLRIP
jgi:uncharacterized protein (DUF2235 family)